MAAQHKLLTEMYRGDTKEFAFTFKNGLGATVNVSGHRVFVAFKVSKADADVDAEVYVEHVAGSGSQDLPLQGLVVVTLPSDQTKLLTPGNYFYEFQHVEPGTPPKVHTIEQGTVAILEDVVRDDA